MKCWGLLVMLALAGMPAWSANKVTVAELKDMLHGMHKAGKSDADVAAALKQLELSEELTRATMNSLSVDVPGPLSTEQIYVFEARSAMLAPPASDIPTASAPDAAAQKAMLDKAADYVSKTYSQLPALSATKTTVRFQDNIEGPALGSGVHGSAQDVTRGSGLVSPYQFIRYINSTDTHVAIDHGAEKMPAEKDKTPWGANKMIALQAPVASLATVFEEAQGSGSVKFARWEWVNGRQAAVYSFAVAKKKAHLPMDICCFPDVSQGGSIAFNPGAGDASGNVQSNTTYDVHFKNSVPYHGELFIDPDSGMVVRMIAESELKPSDVVHQVDQRIDYGPVTAGGKTLIVPVKAIVDTEVVPNGDSGSAARSSVRRTMFASDYKDYQLGQ